MVCAHPSVRHAQETNFIREGHLFSSIEYDMRGLFSLNMWA